MTATGGALQPEGSFEPIRDQLLERREKLRSSLRLVRDDAPLRTLLREVDDALERMKAGVYGLCEVCHDPIEGDRLAADPLVRNCLDHLTSAQRRALEEDLDLACRIQRELLPKPLTQLEGWAVSHHYEAAGPVSGDYCDLMKNDAGELYFLLGDVSGKGIAASMLMSHLHALFRTLITTGLPLTELIGRANRLFCESTGSDFFATLVVGMAEASGLVRVCNAGHCPPLWVRAAGITPLEATGIPLGIFCSSSYTATEFRMEPGEKLVLYTDGLSEAQDSSGLEYGQDRIMNVLERDRTGSVQETVAACLADVSAHLGTARKNDDLAIMVVQRVAD